MEYNIEIFLSYTRSSNIYIILENKEALVVDAGLPEFASTVVTHIKDLKNVQRVHLVFTHCHYDHVFGYTVFRKSFKKVETYAHELDANDIKNATIKTYSVFFGAREGVPVDHLLKEGDSLSVGSLDVKVLHTPGHTEGSITLLLDERAFVGDLIFNRSFGRYDLLSGNPKDLKKSILRLSKMEKLKVIYPGHGSIISSPRENFEIVLSLLDNI
ncbi:MAG TPA: MBL fold metallo-hydrolase [Thermoprotei archaeon]|nr:MBL fold metallo-hydrolase [Thermoprotei archaeon]